MEHIKAAHRRRWASSLQCGKLMWEVVACCPSNPTPIQ
jgi:hypothetical protein